jgi:hypothetical protein
MRIARRLIFAAFVITGLPALALLVAPERWAGSQTLGICMAVSALLLVVGVSRAAVSLLSAPVTRDPLNVVTCAFGVVGLVTIAWFGWHMLT